MVTASVDLSALPPDTYALLTDGSPDIYASDVDLIYNASGLAPQSKPILPNPNPHAVVRSVTASNATKVDDLTFRLSVQIGWKTQAGTSPTEVITELTDKNRQFIVWVRPSGAQPTDPPKLKYELQLRAWWHGEWRVECLKFA